MSTQLKQSARRAQRSRRDLASAAARRQKAPVSPDSRPVRGNQEVDRQELERAKDQLFRVLGH